MLIDYWIDSHLSQNARNFPYYITNSKDRYVRLPNIHRIKETITKLYFTFQDVLIIELSLFFLDH